MFSRLQTNRVPAVTPLLGSVAKSEPEATFPPVTRSRSFPSRREANACVPRGVLPHGARAGSCPTVQGLPCRRSAFLSPALRRCRAIPLVSNVPVLLGRPSLRAGPGIFGRLEHSCDRTGLRGRRRNARCHTADTAVGISVLNS